MAVIQRTITTLNGLVNPNLVAGSAFEYPQQPSQVSIGITQETGGVFFTIYAGARLIAEEFPGLVGTTFPNTQDSFYYNFVILPGERLVVVARNAAGADRVVRIICDLQAVA